MAPKKSDKGKIPLPSPEPDNVRRSPARAARSVSASPEPQDGIDKETRAKEDAEDEAAAQKKKSKKRKPKSQDVTPSRIKKRKKKDDDDDSYKPTGKAPKMQTVKDRTGKGYITKTKKTKA